MRNRFTKTMEDLATENQKVAYFRSIGNRMFDKFKEKAPGRFINVGLQRQT